MFWGAKSYRKTWIDFDLLFGHSSDLCILGIVQVRQRRERGSEIGDYFYVFLCHILSLSWFFAWMSGNKSSKKGLNRENRNVGFWSFSPKCVRFWGEAGPVAAMERCSLQRTQSGNAIELKALELFFQVYEKNDPLLWVPSWSRSEQRCLGFKTLSSPWPDGSNYYLFFRILTGPAAKNKLC